MSESRVLFQPDAAMNWLPQALASTTQRAENRRMWKRTSQNPGSDDRAAAGDIRSWNHHSRIPARLPGRPDRVWFRGGDSQTLSGSATAFFDATWVSSKGN